MWVGGDDEALKKYVILRSSARVDGRGLKAAHIALRYKSSYSSGDVEGIQGSRIETCAAIANQFGLICSQVSP